MNARRLVVWGGDNSWEKVEILNANNCEKGAESVNNLLELMDP